MDDRVDHCVECCAGRVLESGQAPVHLGRRRPKPSGSPWAAKLSAISSSSPANRHAFGALPLAAAFACAAKPGIDVAHSASIASVDAFGDGQGSNRQQQRGRSLRPSPRSRSSPPTRRRHRRRPGASRAACRSHRSATVGVVAPPGRDVSSLPIEQAVRRPHRRRTGRTVRRSRVTSPVRLR